MNSSELPFEINPSDLPFVPEAYEVEAVDAVEAVEADANQEDEVNAITVAEDLEAEAVEVEAVPTEHSLVNTFDEQLFVQLGDIIQIIFNGRTLIGKVYYRDYDQLHVKSIHDSNVLHIFEYKNNEADEAEEFKDEYGVTSVAIIEKRIEESFVEQNHFEAGKQIITFIRKDISDITYTDLYKNYIIIDVNRDEDHITIEDDEKQRETIEFNFIGIPLDMPFVMIADQVKEATPVIGDEVESEEALAEAKEAEAESEEPEDVIEYLGSFEITLGEEYREAAAFEQTIPDSIQKIDAFNDFIMQLSTKDQNNPKEIRNIRILVETLFYLKQAIIEYSKDGSRHRLKKISVDTFVELIESMPVPLGRPILSTNKKLYMNDDEDDIVHPDITSIFFLNELNDMVSHSESYAAIKTKLVQESIQEWTNQKQFLTTYLSPWTAKEGKPLWNAIVDSDFFRQAIPEVNEGVFEKKIPGYHASHSEKEAPLLDLLPFGVERALSTTFRKGLKRRKEALTHQESAPVVAYLVFPVKVAPQLGIIRCNHLATDSGSSQFPHKTMKTILTELGEPMEGGSSNAIQLFNPSGETIGNIQLSDYMNGMDIQSLNIHDTFYILQQYGLTDIELSKALYKVLATKIKNNQNKFKVAMDKLRQEVIKVNPAPNKFIEELSFMDDLRAQLILQDEIDNYEKFNPSLKESDIGLISYLIKNYSNYIQVTAGQKPLYIAKAKNDVERLRYLQEQINLRLVALNQPYDRPRPNPCKHVGMLVTIRRKYDDNERFSDLTQFFKKYQGPRNDNWIDCNVCNEHLLCIHERLQIQGYLNPAEKVSIDKEIILKFAGGQFQGRYICRNCGQPIKEFDFDSTVEFDDSGRPKSGNAVLVDDDADLEKKVDELLDPSALKTDNTLLLNAETTVYYAIIRKLCQFIEVSLKTEQIQHIIDNISQYMKATVPTQQKYIEKTKKQTEDAKQKGQPLPKVTEYAIYQSKMIISISTAYVLLEIQCTVPPILKRYRMKQKEYGLIGFPLDTDPTSVETIELFAIALSSCFKNEHPWNKTELLDVSEEKRISTLKKNLQAIFNSILKSEVIQTALYQRRFYKSPDVVDREVLPLSFLPEQIKSISPEQLDPSKIIIPEVATNTKTRLALIQFWILHAHQVAQTSAELTRGSTFAETTCCRKNITDPSAIWDSDEFQKIDIGLRSLTPKYMKLLLTEFVPRPQNTELIEADESLYYRLFLKCCFTGPRMGHSHEPGLTYKCPWCEFQFPGDPRVMNTDTEGKAELEKSEVKIDNIEFKKLITAIHNLHIVPSVRQQRVSSVFNELDDFQESKEVNVDPCIEWNTLIVDTMKKIKTLGPAADELSQVAALEELAEVSYIYITNVKDSLPKDSRGNPAKSISSRTYENILDSIVDLPWMQFFDVVQMYFIIPLQRILSNFTDKMLYPTYEMKESLSEQHVDSDIRPMLAKELSFYTSFDINVAIESDLQAQLGQRATVSEDVLDQEKERILAQITSYVHNLSCMMEYKHKLRFRNLSEESRDELFKYIKKLILYGALDLLFQGANTVLVNIILFHLNKFNAEKLSFNPLEIKSMIEVVNERERTLVIEEFDVMSEELKAIENMKKRLGIGKWAIGGTKLIYAYDKDYYDLERERRLDAGIIDFPGLGLDYMPSSAQVDDLGFGELNDADVEQGGYDNNQHADDDYE